MNEKSEQKHQACWVLLSASADHPSNLLEPQLLDHDLLTARQLNADQPDALHQKVCKRSFSRGNEGTAVLLVGELRCFTRSGDLFSSISRSADLFIVTTSRYADSARSLVPEERLLIIEDQPSQKIIDGHLGVNSMKQWHKLNLALQLVRTTERRKSRRYRHVMKLRSDFFYVHPQRIIRDVIEQSNHPESGLVGSSDKVFGGPRDLMMLFQAFFQNLEGWFDKREQDYWPINLAQVLASDDALKWYGMNWPVELIGQPETTHSWRQRLQRGGDSLAKALAEFRPGIDTKYHRLFQGHPRFASEVSFARFLNFNGIPFRNCRSLRGFLYSDRNTCP